MRFEVDGLPAYAYTGSRSLVPGQPAVVFVHGGGLDHSVWIHQSRYFAHHGFNVAALDLAGHGRSAGAPPDTITGMAHWVMRAADALGIERLSVAGHSMGSLVALEVAGLYPDRIEAAAVRRLRGADGGHQRAARCREGRQPCRLRHDHAVGTPHGCAARRQSGAGMWMTGGAVRLLERSGRGVLHNDLNACNEYRHGLETAAKVACPTHVVLGREDVMAPPRAARNLIAALSVVRVTELADCGHMLMAEQPDAVRDALAAAFPDPGG